MIPTADNFLEIEHKAIRVLTERKLIEYFKLKFYK